MPAALGPSAAAGYSFPQRSRIHRHAPTTAVQEELVQRDLSTEELDWIVGQSTRSPHWVAAAYCAAGMFSDYQREAQEVDGALRPLFVVAESSADRAKTYLDTRLPNAKAEFFGGHMMFWEYPEKFNAILERYLHGLD